MVIIKKYEKLISIMLLIFIMPSIFSFNNISYAVDAKNNVDDEPKISQELREEMKDDLKAWLNDMDNDIWRKQQQPIFCLKYLHNDTIYESAFLKIDMPKQSRSGRRCSCL